MPSALTPRQIAFDAAVKRWSNFDFRGVAHLHEIEGLDRLIPQLIELRDHFNAALAVEGQHIIGDAPHAPFYFDYLDSDLPQARAFADDDHSFIGITVPMVVDILNTAQQVADSDEVVSSAGLPISTDREKLGGVLFWILLDFVIAHEYAHHTHGHFSYTDEGDRAALRLRQQACELDADGWAAYLGLNHWVLADGRPPLMTLLGIDDATPSAQDVMGFACFVIAQAAFTFIYSSRPVNAGNVYAQSHPPQPVRLQMMSRHVLKFISEFRPAVREAFRQPWYQASMDAVSRLLWTDGKHAGQWHDHRDFLHTPEGEAYREGLIRELDTFRETLRQREADARAAIESLV